MTDTIAHVLIALSALAGALIAALGLKTWRYELHGRTEYELARRVLACVYQIRTEIQQIRNIFSPEFIDTQYERLNRKASELDAALLEAEVLWGDKLNQAKVALKACLIDLRENMRRRFRSQREGLRLSEKQQEEMDSMLDGDKDDDFGRRVQEAVRAFEDILRRHMRSGASRGRDRT